MSKLRLFLVVGRRQSITLNNSIQTSNCQQGYFVTFCVEITRNWKRIYCRKLLSSITSQANRKLKISRNADILMKMQVMWSVSIGINKCHFLYTMLSTDKSPGFILDDFCKRVIQVKCILLLYFSGSKRLNTSSILDPSLI